MGCFGDSLSFLMGVVSELESGVEVEVDKRERRRFGVLTGAIAEVVELRREGEESRRGETDLRGDSDLTRDRAGVGDGEGRVCDSVTMSLQ